MKHNVPNNIMPLFLWALILWCLICNIIQCLTHIKYKHIFTFLQNVCNFTVALHITKTAVTHWNATHARTHAHLTAFSMTTQVSWYQKGKTNLDFTEARDSEWQWHQLGHCKSAPCSRQTTTPALYHSVFYRLDALPAAQPTASKHWRHSTEGIFTVELHITETAVTHWHDGLHILQQLHFIHHTAFN